MNEDINLKNLMQRTQESINEFNLFVGSLLIKSKNIIKRMCNLITILLLATVIFITSCLYITPENVYPSPPKGPLKVWVGEGITTTAETCEFSFLPPTGENWRMPPGKWGPNLFILSFSRFNDKLFWRRWEHIVICSIEDTLLWNANPAEKEEWLQKLLGDPYTSEYFKEKFIERKLTVESVENFELGSRNYLVVNYKGSTSYKNQKPCFSRGLVYVMKSPCDLWKGVIVFQLVDSKYGSPPIDSFSSTGALESFIGIVRSFTYIEKSQKKK